MSICVPSESVNEGRTGCERRTRRAVAGARVAMLQHAWDEVFAALDRVDAQKAQALRTISSASTPD